jgi:hypothetical protein
MKKILLFPIITLIFLFILSSCSVQKRLYRDGYSIQWNHQKNDVKQNALQNIESETTVSAEENSAKDYDFLPVEEAAKPAIEDELALYAPSKDQPAAKKKGLIARIIQEDTPEEIEAINNGSKAASFKSGFKKGLSLMSPVQDGRITGWAIASFVLGILSMFAYYGAFLLGVLAIVFGIIAIRKIGREGTYRGNTLAWLGIIFGIIGIILATVIIRVYA